MTAEGKGTGPAKGSMRDVMPQTAAFIDQLRAQWGAAQVDALLRKAKAGGAVAYFAELDSAGVLRQWGAPPRGRQAQVVDGQLVRGDAR